MLTFREEESKLLEYEKQASAYRMWADEQSQDNGLKDSAGHQENEDVTMEDDSSHKECSEATEACQIGQAVVQESFQKLSWQVGLH